MYLQGGQKLQSRDASLKIRDASLKAREESQILIEGKSNLRFSLNFTQGADTHRNLHKV